MILYVIFETARNGGLFCVQKNMREITGTGEFFERGSFRLNGKTLAYFLDQPVHPVVLPYVLSKVSPVVVITF